jgi:D-alanyl-D-alanine carboxypeptidase
MIFDFQDVYYEDLVGGKTGYTDTSRHTLVSYAKRDGKNLIAVIMQAEKNVPYTDSIALYDYGFASYGDVKILDKNEYQTEVSVYTEENTMRVIELVPHTDVTLSLPQTFDVAAVDKKLSYETTARFDVKKGDTYGTLALSYNGAPLGEAELIVSNITEKTVPATHESTGAHAVFNNMPDESDAQTTGFPVGKILIAFAVAIALAIAAALLYRAHRLRRRRLSRRRYREIGARGYRYKDNLNNYRGR